MQILDFPKRYGERIILLFIVLLGIVLTCYRIAEPPWSGQQGGYVFAEYPHNARNHLRFGYWETKLGLVMDYGWLKPSEGFHYRVDHPFLLSFLISLSYLFFDVHEWSARIPSVLLSVGEVVIIYLLGCALFGRRREALLAAFFAALFPVRCFYGRLTDPSTLASFFGLLTFLFYQLWISRHNKIYYISMYLSFIAGAFSDWGAYFVVPAILTHYLLWEHSQNRNWRFIFTFGLLPFLTFGLHVGWMYSIAGWSPLQDFFNIIFLNRLASIGNIEEAFTTTELYQLAYRRFLGFFSLPVIVISFIWLVAFLIKTLWPLGLRIATRGGLLRTESKNIPVNNYNRQETFLFALFLFPLSHDLIFRNVAFIHDYIIYKFIPFFAFSAAFFPTLVARSVSPRVRKVAIICIIFIIICSFTFESVRSFAQLNRSLQSVLMERAKYLAGKEINRIVPKKAKIMLSFKPPLVLLFYVDRPWTRVTDLQTFQSLLQMDQSFTHYIFDSMTPCSKELRRYLVENHPSTNFYNFTIFDLQRSGSTVLTKETDISHRINANFADKILFLGYNVDTTIRHNDREITWWERYFNPNLELLPEYRTTFHITYFWQCLEEVEEDYSIQDVFEGYYGKLYLVDHLHQPVNGSYPTSLWRKGEIVKEEYELEIPYGFPPLQYTFWLGVQKGDGERLKVSAQTEVENNRVKAGVVSVEPLTPPPSLSDAPSQMQKRVEADMNGEILLSGYDLEPSLPSTGDKLKLTTYWRCLQPPDKDYRAFLFLKNGIYEHSYFLPLGLTRLWQQDRFYRSEMEIPLHPYLLPGTYSLELRLEKKGGFKSKLKLAEIDIQGPRKHIITQVGETNYSDKDAPLLESAEPFSLPFTVSRGQDVEVVVGWPESLSRAKTRVDVYLKNEFWRKHLKTWIINKDKYNFTKLRIPANLINVGENIIELHPASPPSRTRYSGWRGVVDWLFPDLLQDPLLHDDYEDWARPDFMQVYAVKWKNSWNDYYDLAQVYYQNNMFKEVANLWEEALSKNLQLERRIDVNLGDKVQVLGGNFIPQGGGQVQIELYFRCLEKMAQDYTLWLHAEAADTEEEVGQDHFTFDHLLTTMLWERGMIYKDAYLAELTPGRYHFTFGLWRWQNEERLWTMDEPKRHEIDLGYVEVR